MNDLTWNLYFGFSSFSSARQNSFWTLRIISSIRILIESDIESRVSLSVSGSAIHRMASGPFSVSSSENVEVDKIFSNFSDQTSFSSATLPALLLRSSVDWALREKKPLTTEIPDVVQDVNVARNIFIFYLKFSGFFFNLVPPLQNVMPVWSEFNWNFKLVFVINELFSYILL